MQENVSSTKEIKIHSLIQGGTRDQPSTTPHITARCCTRKYEKLVHTEVTAPLTVVCHPWNQTARREIISGSTQHTYTHTQLLRNRDFAYLASIEVDRDCACSVSIRRHCTSDHGIGAGQEENTASKLLYFVHSTVHCCGLSGHIVIAGFAANSCDGRQARFCDHTQMGSKGLQFTLRKTLPFVHIILKRTPGLLRTDQILSEYSRAWFPDRLVFCLF